MKLQIALDEMTLGEGMALCEKVRKSIDIIEMGTPFLMKYGAFAIREFKNAFPEKEILADVKIMDAGEYEAKICFDAGADYVTVLGVTDSLTVKGCLVEANKMGRAVVVDMICVQDLEKRVHELENLGVKHIAVHTGVDQQAAGRTPKDDLRQMKNCAKKAFISVAGGINVDTIDEYKALGADVAIVGGGIAHASDPADAAYQLASRCHA